MGTVTLPGLTATVQAGLFTAAPSSGNATTTTGAFRHIGLSWPAAGWTATNVGGTGPNGVGQPGTFRQGGGVLTMTGGSGDIAPLTGGAGVTSVQRALLGTFFGLIPLIVAAAMFITGEYRRGLIRVSLTAAPRRGRLLAAKTVVIAAVGFAAGVAAAVLAIAVARHLDQIGPLPAGLDAQATTGIHSLPLTPWQGLGVVALWAAGALLLGALALKFRDA